jgi:uncharacterized membrane protein
VLQCASRVFYRNPAGQFETILSLNKTKGAGLRFGQILGWYLCKIEMKKIFTPRFMAEAGIIAALYFALTMAIAPVAYGPLQIRISEALCVLPFFTPAAVPGLFVGCILANLFSPFGIYDIVFGSLATLLAAFITYRVRIKWLLPLPTIVVNALVIGAELTLLATLPQFSTMLTPTIFWLSVLYVGAGEAIACYALGMPLFFLLNRHKKRLFGQRR